MDTPDDHRPRALDASRRRPWPLMWGLVALGCVGVAAALYTMLAVAVQPFPCVTFEPICNGTIRNLVASMPMLTLIAGLLAGAIGGGIAVHRRRSAGWWVLGAWLLFLSGCVYSWATLGTGPDTHAMEAQAADERAERVAAMRARTDFETIQARYGQMQEQFAGATAAAVPGLRWPNSSLLDESGSLCTWDHPSGHGFHGVGAASVVGYAAITDAQWVALDAAIRDVAARYGFTGPPAHRSTGPAEPEPPQFSLSGPDGARLDGYLERFGHDVRLTFTTPCYLPKAQR
ncbi:LppA family lipoprotein [Amycolatopsis sp. RTGN1]|uniref:LppA family lipoprotein n=1 Tax=Amycolatopsis ponsaeliensis TaxID=2992142 RepID=UPI0025506E0A|nr:LppA family lipoprotein [Amycolatopsis sp. RTGN1]